MAVTATDLVKWLGQPTTDTELMAQAAQAVTMALAMVDAYTRGTHLTVAGDTRPGIDAVVLMASARMLANPEGLKYATGVVSFSEAFSGFTLAERIVLDRYRKRAA
ncbi:hypothetical protein IA539_16175 [Gordonia sp. zg691]|uniref:hypothetical protein n=1 Tax=Gordonia jinghuaiqii TaxID=2758710 RepID=UPI001662855F|nr:hypothetical protein [Gordonia jinghuaiqii]MBD0862730.1 hypothetical protein [Gordonia jinghuaiqii]